MLQCCKTVSRARPILPPWLSRLSALSVIVALLTIMSAPLWHRDADAGCVDDCSSEPVPAPAKPCAICHLVLQPTGSGLDTTVIAPALAAAGVLELVKDERSAATAVERSHPPRGPPAHA